MLDLAQGPVFANSRSRGSPKIKGSPRTADSTEISPGEFAKESFGSLASWEI